MYSLNVQVAAYGRQTVPGRGVVRSCDPLKILVAAVISLERLNLKSSVKICTHVGYVSSNNMMTYHPQKGMVTIT